ncbi:hypothetical protein BU25DRAFT_408151 [Macroventuria anomochaeta]|uniref:Uncharacterized protein n=1 Tax=Macroventuria anomochaeta TaxID=301207 RepID=A0ACB6SC10_9PLEO|nr:uncharacterized protein BU25DRAFT_408151 [Macroventuria anomochaeta]KAF2630878.1 hypothetical protein BU25DRAFT_408151 [Macroventuria anomochaeta]
MRGGLSRLMDKGRHHFRQTLSPTDDAYLSYHDIRCEYATPADHAMRARMDQADTS